MPSIRSQKASHSTRCRWIFKAANFNADFLLIIIPNAVRFTFNFSWILWLMAYMHAWCGVLWCWFCERAYYKRERKLCMHRSCDHVYCFLSQSLYVILDISEHKIDIVSSALPLSFCQTKIVLLQSSATAHISDSSPPLNFMQHKIFLRERVKLGTYLKVSQLFAMHNLSNEQIQLCGLGVGQNKQEHHAIVKYTVEVWKRRCYNLISVKSFIFEFQHFNA